MTLLELTRGPAGLTGPKETCDRASCGACTVLLGVTPVYACSMLAIEAQGAAIKTVEGLAPDARLTTLQQALVVKDGLQCAHPARWNRREADRRGRGRREGGHSCPPRAERISWA